MKNIKLIWAVPLLLIVSIFSVLITEAINLHNIASFTVYNKNNNQVIGGRIPRSGGVVISTIGNKTLVAYAVPKNKKYFVKIAYMTEKNKHLIVTSHYESNVNLSKYGEKINFAHIGNGDKAMVLSSGWGESFEYAPEFFVKTAF